MTRPEGVLPPYSARLTIFIYRSSVCVRPSVDEWFTDRDVGE